MLKKNAVHAAFEVSLFFKATFALAEIVASVFAYVVTKKFLIDLVQGITGRLNHANFGDHRFCRDGVWELRIDVGAGYRVYYAMAGKEIILLLCGGDKRTQDSDIDRACEHWQDWQRRTDDER